MNNNISVIIPIFNEEKAVRETLYKIKEVFANLEIDKFEIIAVNDGSTDNSLSQIKSVEGIKVINNPYNLGYGASLKKGILASQYDWILITDSDGTYPIEKIPDLIKEIKNYDMVVGARIGKNVSISVPRRVGKKIISLLANFLSGKKIPDLNSGLRIFKKSIALKFFHLFPSGFSLTTTITLACLTNDYTVKFIPINYHKRKGESSIKPTRDFFGFLTLIVKVIMYFNPLKFFLTPGILMMVVGGAYLIYRVVVWYNINDTAIIIFITGLQIIFIGLIADLIVKSRK